MKIIFPSSEINYDSSREDIHRIVRSALEGRTITKVVMSSYLDWRNLIEEIELDDGTVLELCGNADVARIDCIYRRDKEGQDNDSK